MPNCEPRSPRPAAARTASHAAWATTSASEISSASPGSTTARPATVPAWRVTKRPVDATLDANDNLRVTSDFRGMYCSLLEQWLGHDAAAIIPGASGFARPTLVAA